MWHNNAIVISVVTTKMCHYTVRQNFSNTSTESVRTVGRPKLSAKDAKSQHVRFRVTKAERALLRKRWKESGEKKEAVWMRKLLLGET